jgi:hypothetical protein
LSSMKSTCGSRCSVGLSFVLVYSILIRLPMTC